MAKGNRRTMNYRDDDFTPISNEPFIEAMREKRRTSAASRHTLLAHKGTRRARDAKAIRDFD